ncbi:type II toxin-antitoxin system ParD family antitoxin [Rhizobium sp. CRIBSB]|nr:type II toxin-antitoxin system ParD family antitoxin [Rhizobium sp. CRIBSB]
MTMSKDQTVTVTLPTELLDLIRAKVASGDYADESQVVSEGLRLLASNEGALEDWLRDEVAPTYDRAMGDPESLLDLDAAFDGIREGLRNSKASVST